MKGERMIRLYVAAERAVRSLAAQDSADMPEYEHHVKLSKDAARASYRLLNGGQIAEARRRLATP